MTDVSGPRLAVNPIAYWLAGGMPDRTTRTLGPAFTELAEIGYTAVKADVPDDMAADGLPAVARVVRAGARAEPVQRRVRRPRHARGARPKRPGASRRRQASFGQRFCMISTIEPPGTPRTRAPGRRPRLRPGPARGRRRGHRAVLRGDARRGRHGRAAPARRRLGGDRARAAHGAGRGRPGPARLRPGHRAHVVGGHGRARGAARLRRPHRRRAPQGHLRRRHRPGQGRRPRLRHGHRSRAGSGPSRGSATSTWPPASRRSPRASRATT